MSYNRMYKAFALFAIVLIISLPAYVSSVFANSNVPDAGKQCIEKHKKTSKIVDALDSGVISALEKVAAVMYGVCMSVAVVLQLLKIIEGICCVSDVSGFGKTLCKIIRKKVLNNYILNGILAFKETICCYITCGWCRGKTCAGVTSGLDLAKEIRNRQGKTSFEKLENFKNSEASKKDIYKGSKIGNIYRTNVSGYDIRDLKLDPFDNIYSAMGCLCPVAILFNMRKLKTIYQTYDCCVEEACKNGLSTEGCEKKFSEATCMYYEGSLFKIAINAIAGIITHLLTKFVVDKVKKMLGGKTGGSLDSAMDMLGCAQTVVQIANIMQMINSVKKSWHWMSVTFEEPDCSDLGFTRIKNEFKERPDSWQYCAVRPANGYYTAVGCQAAK